MTGADLTGAGADRARSMLLALAAAAALAALAVIGWITTPEFISIRNFFNIIRAAAEIGIIAVTMTLITIAGSFFSLSVSQTAAMSAISFAAFLSWGWPVWTAVLAVAVLASLVGLLQGGAVALGGNPIVVTLAMGAVLFGSVAWLTDNKTVRTGTDAAEWIGSSRPLGFPSQTWAFVVIALITAVVLTRTRFGREATLVGANRRAAAAVGIRPGRIAIYVFWASALGAALAGVFRAAQFSQGRLDHFDGMDIEAIAAVLVGGAAIQGGEGSALRTALGAVFIAALQNLMVLRGFSYGVRMFYVGLAILVSVSVYTLARSRRRLA